MTKREAISMGLSGAAREEDSNEEAVEEATAEAEIDLITKRTGMSSMLIATTVTRKGKARSVKREKEAISAEAGGKDLISTRNPGLRESSQRRDLNPWQG